jgi:hypothetical protein
MKKKLCAQSLWFAKLMAGGCAFLVMGAILLPQTASGQASAVQIEPVKSEGITMSPEFRVAIYENLVEEVTKAGGLQHVYRSGDRRATNAPDLLTMHMIVEGFKRGSEKEREVTTVAGWTIIKADVQLVTRDGRTLMDRQVEGKVRLFGGNLNATRDLAKKVAKIILRTEDGCAMNRPSVVSR